MEPYEKEYRVRFRIDGILQNVMAPPMKLKDAITSRIKIMAKLDISEKRLPQDGRIMIKYLKDGKKKELDFRVSTVPTLFGEKIVLRLLDKENLRLGHDQARFRAGIAGQIRAADSEALRHGAGHRPHRFGKNEHALFVGGPAEYHAKPTS